MLPRTSLRLAAATATTLFLAAVFPAAAAPAPAAAELVAIPVGKTNYQIWRGDSHLFSIETRVLNQAWGVPDMPGEPVAASAARTWTTSGLFAPGAPRSREARSAKDAKTGTPFTFSYSAAAVGENTLRLSTRTEAEADAEAVGVACVVSTTDFFRGGKGVSTESDGTTLDFALPVGMGSQGRAATDVLLTAPGGERLRITASSPVEIQSDQGELRIFAWSKKIAAKTPRELDLTFEFFAPLKVETANRFVDTSGWIAYQPRQDFAAGSPIGAEQWLDAPAGKHGRIQIDGDHFVFERKHEPVKFWGANIAYSNMAVEPDAARQWADKFAKYGVNIVRMHKFTGHSGWDGVMSKGNFIEFDEAAAARFDNIHAEFAKRGIYAGWSPIFTPAIDDSMAPYLKHLDEVKAAAAKRSDMFAKTLYPLQNISEEIQDLFIALTVKWLERKNTVTGIRYADDPALAYVELHNEADIFFAGTGALLRNYPTYSRQMQERFAAWLRQRYPDDNALRAAWGEQLKKEESLDAANIFPFPAFDGKMPAARRVVDSYTFLYDYQLGFYRRYLTAIRKTGYQGVIVGGCWQAADMYGHLLNIASDREVGFIDRHNYFKSDRPMLAQPGSALLSAGMQQVGDRPFALSEWAGAHVWGSECPPLIGLVGLGIQGWDYSAQFASNNPLLLGDNIGGINGNFDELRHIAQHPFIARFLYTGALREAPVVASRRISMKELREGKAGFEERFSLLGGANLKNFAGSVPNEAIGAGRVTLDFVDEPVSPAVSMAALDKYWDRQARVLTGANGQTRWDYSGRGFLTVDTAVAQAVVGFGGGRDHVLSGATIRFENPFATLYVATRKPGDTLARAEELVVLALARTISKGDVIEETSMSAYARAEKPRSAAKGAPAPATLLVEPVLATLTLPRPDASACAVYPLDHDGVLAPDAKPLAARRVKDGWQCDLPGDATRSFYYLVRFTR